MTSEWVQDKLQGLHQMGYSVTLITSTSSLLSSSLNLDVIKVGSISRSDRNQEMLDAQVENLKPNLVMGMLGFAFDIFFKLFAGAKSDGKWSWALTGIPVVVRALRLNSFEHVIATGGPSSAHVATVVAAKLMKKKVILEFQDPFIPEMAKMSGLARWMLGKIEQWLVKNCEKYVMVSSKAATTVQERYPHHGARITSCLPGSPRFQLPKKSDEPLQNAPIVFTHLGTLYGSRNLDNFAAAISQVRARGLLDVGGVSIINVGPDGTNADSQFMPDELKVIDRTDRLNGLEISSGSDFLLLVQHTDVRSLETIPHKTYDYLNLQIPIFGLVMNLELKKIIESHSGYVADPNDIEEIKSKFVEAITDHRTGRTIPQESQIDFMQQLESLLA